MKNPEWNRKIGDLSAEIGNKLGFQDVLLDVILSKLVVYGPGGHLDKRQSREEAEDVVATLEVQLPSLHEGGDLVVYDDIDLTKQYRFDFGKVAGTAAFKPSYAVYVAGAEYVLEEVIKGYRVVLMYSIHLPPAEELSGVNRSRRFVQKELLAAVTEFGGKDETFALLLSDEYGGYESFEAEGSDRLAGVDRARFQALQNANSRVPDEKKVKFYIAKVELKASFVKDSGSGGSAEFRSYPRISVRLNAVSEALWRMASKSKATVWFSIDREMLQDWSGENASGETSKWTSQLNLLNPGSISPHEMWSDRVRCIDLPCEATVEYDAYVLVGWPVAHDLKNTTTFIGEEAGLSLIVGCEALGASQLRSFMNLAPGTQRQNDMGVTADRSRYLSFCQNLCNAIRDVGDVELAWLFMTRYFDKLKNKELLAPSLAGFVETFGWDAVSVPITNAINRMIALDAITLALDLTKALDQNSEAAIVATTLAVENAQRVPVSDLSSTERVGLLWRCAVNFPDESIFTAVNTLLQLMDGKLLGPVIEAVSQYVNGNSPRKERIALASLIALRRNSLKAAISQLNKPLSWEIPDAHFPDHVDIENFLRGPKASFVVSGFVDIVAANKFIQDHAPPASALSYIMTAHGIGLSSMVIVTKTRKLTATSTADLDKMMGELNQLSHTLAPLMDTSKDSSVGEKRSFSEIIDEKGAESRKRLETLKGKLTQLAEGLLRRDDATITSTTDNVQSRAA